MTSSSGRAVAVLLVALVAAGGTAGCGRLADRGQPAASAPATAPVPAPATAAATPAATGPGPTAEASGGAPAVDPATVARVEQQADGAQQFLDRAEAQLGQDGG